MVLMTPTDGSSARPSGNARWYGHDEGLGALFDGRKGILLSVNAISRWRTAFCTRVAGGIRWKRLLVRHGWAASEAEMIRIHHLVGDGWIRIISRRLEGLRQRTEALEECYDESDAAGDVQVQSPIWLVSAREMDFGVVQYTK